MRNSDNFQKISCKQVTKRVSPCIRLFILINHTPVPIKLHPWWQACTHHDKLAPIMRTLHPFVYQRIYPINQDLRVSQDFRAPSVLPLCPPPTQYQDTEHPQLVCNVFCFTKYFIYLQSNTNISQFPFLTTTRAYTSKNVFKSFTYTFNNLEF